jgi:hypothetical protein
MELTRLRDWLYTMLRVRAERILPNVYPRDGRPPRKH